MPVVSQSSNLGIAPGSFKAWLIACRPKTLSAAATPVLVGSACAHAAGVFQPGPALAALLGALLLQIGANLANDVFDYEKGADNAARLGPLRVVQAGLLPPHKVRQGMWLSFALALLTGVYLTSVAGPLIPIIGILSIASAIAYTGGPYPLGYHGLGDLFVFVFFGLVAVCGTYFVQAGHVAPLAVWASIPIGLLSAAILAVNNLRDRETDANAGKRTLAVRWGRRGVVIEYGVLIVAAYLVPAALVFGGTLALPGLLPWLSLPLAFASVKRVIRDTGSALNASLVNTAKLLLIFGVLLALGIAAGGPSEHSAALADSATSPTAASFQLKRCPEGNRVAMSDCWFWGNSCCLTHCRQQELPINSMDMARVFS